MWRLTRLVLTNLCEVEGVQVEQVEHGGEGGLVDAVGGKDGLHAAGEQRAVEGPVGEQLAEVVDVEPLLLRLQECTVRG